MAPKFYKARFIEPGIISYEDASQGVVLVSKDALDRMAPTFRGCPVIFTKALHNDADKDSAFDPDNPLAESKCGIVTGIPYWGDDGWQWVDFEVEDENVQNIIDKGYSVSCAYDVDGVNEGGEYHQIPYDEEVTNGHYLHMAIVPRPRYEGSTILANSKGGHQVAIFNRPKQNAAPPAPIPKKKEPAKAPAHAEPDGDEGKTMLNDDAEVDVNGTRVPLHELMSAYMEKHGQGEPEPEEMDPSKPVTLPDGTSITIGELVADYSGGGEEGNVDPLQNAEEPTGTKAAPPVDASKQGSTRTNAAPAKPAPKVNQKLKNAAAQSSDDLGMGHPETKTDRLARGASRYSKAVAQSKEGK